MMGNAWVPLRVPSNDNLEAIIEERYNFGEADDVHGFLTKLRERSTRDVMPDHGAATFKQRRDSAGNELKAIIAGAAAARDSLTMLVDRVQKFRDDYEYNPMLIESILHVDMGPPNELFPEALVPFNEVTESPELFAEMDATLAGLADLRLRGIGGPIPHIALQKAVAECRAFWRGAKRTWKPDFLDALQPGDRVEQLSGACERFVADALGAGGFDFTMPDLATAFAKASRVNVET